MAAGQRKPSAIRSAGYQAGASCVVNMHTSDACSECLNGTLYGGNFSTSTSAMASSAEPLPAAEGASPSRKREGGSDEALLSSDSLQAQPTAGSDRYRGATGCVPLLK